VLPVEYKTNGRGKHLNLAITALRVSQSSSRVFLRQMNSVHFHIKSLSIDGVFRLCMEMELCRRVLLGTSEYFNGMIRCEVIGWADAGRVRIRHVDLNDLAQVQRSGFDKIGVRANKLVTIALLERIAVHVSSQINWTLIRFPTVTVLVQGPVGAIE
jgi:hypothetical protein